MKDLGTICRNTICIGDHADATFEQLTLPTAIQQRAFELLGVAIDTAK